MSKTLKILVFIIVIPFLLVSCKGPDGKYKFGGDARKFPADPEERVKQNLKEGRGFRLNDTFKDYIDSYLNQGLEFLILQARTQCGKPLLI